MSSKIDFYRVAIREGQENQNASPRRRRDWKIGRISTVALSRVPPLTVEEERGDQHNTCAPHTSRRN